VEQAFLAEEVVELPVSKSQDDLICLPPVNQVDCMQKSVVEIFTASVSFLCSSNYAQGDGAASSQPKRF
jgi:hypothetical protein